MSSKRAKRLITQTCNCPKNTGIPYNENRAHIEVKDVEEIVRLAEQDAEQRCVKIIEYVLLEKLGSTMARNILLEIKNNLNNGGQSDE